MLEPLFRGQPTNLMLDGIAFNIDLRHWDASTKTVRLAYKLILMNLEPINPFNY